jgi:hypothetical protein
VVAASDPLLDWGNPQPAESSTTETPAESAGEAVLEEAREAAVLAGYDEADFDDDLGDAGQKSTKDVPTWEDALSQLPRGGGGSGGGSSSGSAKNSGGRKRRRRRRRGKSSDAPDAAGGSDGGGDDGGDGGDGDQ